MAQIHAAALPTILLLSPTELRIPTKLHNTLIPLHRTHNRPIHRIKTCHNILLSIGFTSMLTIPMNFRSYVPNRLMHTYADLMRIDNRCIDLSLSYSEALNGVLLSSWLTSFQEVAHALKCSAAIILVLSIFIHSEIFCGLSIYVLIWILKFILI